MDSLYDEFGNYIGPDIDSDDDEGSFQEAAADKATAVGAERSWAPTVDEADKDSEASHEIAPGVDAMEDDEGLETGAGAIILHEDKKYYPTADEIYGEDVEALVEDEDAQPITEPIIAPVKGVRFEHAEKELPETVYNKDYMAGLMDHPDLVRNVALLGHIHHGKTLLMDSLVEQTHVLDFDPYEEMKYTDTRLDEQERGLSFKAVPMSLVLPDRKDKSYLINLIDTPGHVAFLDEISASVRLCDGVCIVVDALEGLMLGTEKAIKIALQEKLDICLLVNKIDRLILELKIPPAEAFHKLRHVIDSVNESVQSYWTGLPEDAPRLSPELGNVAFGSSLFHFSFTLDSFADLYSSYFGSFDSSMLSKRLWGDFYFHEKSRTFKKKPASAGGPRSFVQFVLEPLYKIIGQVISQEISELQVTLSHMGIEMHKKELEMDAKPLLKVVMSRFFGPHKGLTEMMVKHIRSPLEAAKSFVEHTFTGDISEDNPIVSGMLACDSRAPCVVHVCKLYPTPDLSGFSALGRVVSGSMKAGQRVRVLGEGYSPFDPEDMTVKEVEAVYLSEARYRVKVSRVPAGCWALIDGVDDIIVKTATVVADGPHADNMTIFRPLNFDTAAVVKVAVEPLNPSELPKMLQGIRSVTKTYPLVTTKVEESGEHVLLGTGELQLDCVLHDLRKVFSNIEVKVADPSVSFCETVVETSSLKCFAETPNRKNKLTMISEPMEKGLSEDIENGMVKLTWTKKVISEFFQSKYDWDILAARSIWAFGPTEHGPNVLLDDTLPSEVDKKALLTVKDSIIQGFQWGTREGPLCDEPIRNVKFKILDATISSDPIARGAGQIIPTARRVAYSAFLLATPRLMEPVNTVEIECPADCVAACYTVLSRRRGHVVSETPKAGTPLTILKALIPTMDSFGFETDLRSFTQGQAFCLHTFDHWAIAPGDPLDRSIVLRPLEPSTPQQLAREYMIKTRRRKGLSEDVTINKFFDDPMLIELAKQEADLLE